MATAAAAALGGSPSQLTAELIVPLVMLQPAPGVSSDSSSFSGHPFAVNG
jgi:hypothetical protein